LTPKEKLEEKCEGTHRKNKGTGKKDSRRTKKKRRGPSTDTQQAKKKKTARGTTESTFEENGIREGTKPPIPRKCPTGDD